VYQILNYLMIHDRLSRKCECA